MLDRTTFVLNTAQCGDALTLLRSLPAIPAVTAVERERISLMLAWAMQVQHTATVVELERARRRRAAEVLSSASFGSARCTAARKSIRSPSSRTRRSRPSSACAAAPIFRSWAGGNSSTVSCVPSRRSVSATRLTTVSRSETAPMRCRDASAHVSSAATATSR